jgi:hypothetical protein
MIKKEDTHMENKLLFETKHCKNCDTCAAVYDWSGDHFGSFTCTPDKCRHFLLKEEYKKGFINADENTKTE